MKLRKAMAVALTGALVLTTFATGTTSEAAKKTKLKTKKVSIFVKGKKKISITGKKAKHKYTFTSKKKKIAKVSKKGVITGVKAGKTTITVKDTWKQKGKKKSKKLGTINVTVKKKTTPKPKVTAQVSQPPVTPIPAPPTTQVPGDGNLTPTDNPVTPTPGVTPTKTPKVTKEPTPTPVATQAPPPPEEQVPTKYAPLDMSQLKKPDDAGKEAVLTYDAETNTITGEKILQFGVPLGYTVKNGHAVWVRIQGQITGENGFRCWLQDEVERHDRCSEVWEELASPNLDEGRDFDKTFQLVSDSDNATHLWFKGLNFETPIDGIKITSIEVSYPLGEGSTKPDPEAPTAEMTLAKHAITEESATTAEVSVSAGEVKDVTWSVGDTTIATAVKDETDAKKATITGVAEGKTKVTAEVKVTVEGKDFTVKAEQDLTVAAKDALVVNASIESAPTEMTVGDAVELKVAADVGTIESVVWAVEGEAATVETDSVDVVKAVLKAVKPGVVMVSATVTVKDGDKTATDTAKATINVKEPTSYNLDLTEFDAKGQNVIVNNDGSIEITHLASYQGTGISVSEGVTCVELSAVSYQDGQELGGQQQIQLYDTEGNKIAETYNKGAITLVVPKGKTLGKIVVNAQNASPNKPQTMKIDYIRVHKYNSISLDLSKFDPKSGTVVVNADGSIKVTYTAAYTGAGIEVGDVKGTIKYISVGGLPQQQKQVKIENSAGEEIVGAQYWGEELLFEIPEDKTPAKVVVNAQDIIEQPEISIGYITLYVEE